MANRKISDLTALTAPVTGDLLPIVDISEAAAADKNKKITYGTFLSSVPLGTAAAPSIAFTGDINTGIYSPGADQVAISTNGVARLTSSTTALTSALAVDVPLGAAATPSLTFTGDLNTGIYSPGADQVAVATNGTGRLFVDANGNIGVGTSSPANFAGFVTLALADSSGSEIDFIKGSTVQSSLYNANDIFYVESKSTVPIAFVTNGAERLRITDAGLVGIGTSAPGAPTHIVATGGSTNSINVGLIVDYEATAAEQTGAGTAILFRGKSSGGNIANHSQAQIATNNAGTNNAHGLSFYYRQDANDAIMREAFRYDAFGRVGIGTTSPGVSLEVAGPTGDNIISTFRSGDATAANNAGGGFRSISSATAASRVAQIWLDADGANFSGGDYFFIQKNGNSGTVDFNQFSNAAMTFKTNDTERARIDSSGRLLVGTSSVHAPCDGLLSVVKNSASTASPAIGVINPSATAAYVSFSDSAVVYGSITRVSSTTAYNTTSDYRLKTVIGVVSDAGQRIDSLRPVEYTWNADSSRSRGFLAHEFQEVYAGSVSGTKDAVDAVGNPIYQAMQASTSEVIADLVAEIQSLRARLAALETN